MAWEIVGKNYTQLKEEKERKCVSLSFYCSLLPFMHNDSSIKMNKLKVRADVTLSKWSLKQWKQPAQPSCKSLLVLFLGISFTKTEIFETLIIHCNEKWTHFDWGGFVKTNNLAFLIGMGWDSVQEGSYYGRASNKSRRLSMEFTHIVFWK